MTGGADQWRPDRSAQVGDLGRADAGVGFQAVLELFDLGQESVEGDLGGPETGFEVIGGHALHFV
jgi:hypothetical protein